MYRYSLLLAVFLLLFSNAGAQARPNGGDTDVLGLVTVVTSVPSVLATGLNAAPDGWFGHPNTSRRWRSLLGKGTGGGQMLIGGLLFVTGEPGYGALNLGLGALSYSMGLQTEKRLKLRLSPIPTSQGRRDRGLSVGVTLRL
jgi:hypothetical protein